MARALALLSLWFLATHASAQDTEPIEVVEHSELGGPQAEAEVAVDGEVELGWLGIVFDVELLGVGVYAPPVRAQLNLAAFIGVAWHPWVEVGVYSGVFGVAPRTDSTYRVGGQVRVNVPLGLGRQNLERFIAFAVGAGAHLYAPEDDVPVSGTVGPWGTAAVMMRWIDLTPQAESHGAPWAARVGAALGVRYHFLHGGDPSLLGRERGHAVVGFFSFALSLERF
ncbi:MAG: hypothetical protein JJ863_13790 [Deltaproteobacteria bacterium]|nr:hypothetical protein [Deltaproteobacteria bacterium]